MALRRQVTDSSVFIFYPPSYTPTMQIYILPHSESFESICPHVFGPFIETLMETEPSIREQKFLNQQCIKFLRKARHHCRADISLTTRRIHCRMLTRHVSVYPTISRMSGSQQCKSASIWDGTDITGYHPEGCPLFPKDSQLEHGPLSHIPSSSMGYAEGV